MDARYKYETTPLANPQAVVLGLKYRFTVLSSRLIRAEYNENGIFEDRSTSTVVNRNFPLVKFTVCDCGEYLTITTEHIELKYYKEEFNEHSLFIRYVGNNASVNAGFGTISGEEKVWSYNLKNANNIKGSARTLDNVNGACELENGLMSFGSVTTLDDSKTLVLTEDGWVSVRSQKSADTYLFCYGDAKKGFDNKACLKDYYTLTGHTPLLPRYALGNWWSRFYAYTQEEYINLMNRFKQEDIPFSVCVIDMDWHIRNIPSKYGTGWTGYTWNEELFPDYKKFLKYLHSEGYAVTLNVHPAEGLAAHEKAYSDMASAMGIDPKSEETVQFDITNSKFLENYFEYMHHPLEKDGVDFWWMDWQQGNTTRIAGLDTLWMLNHYHYVDNDRGERRPMIFSRYSGPGSHRYPIGFSGDTHITWESLDFQPYFTANASNIGYGWWSHDIGGHMAGYRDDELAARWVQFGVFSPINRLHSGGDVDKAPWKYNVESEQSMKKFLKLRHEMIPYLYSMNYRASYLGEPLLMPLYYNWNDGQARENRNEYTFGTEMLVKPITTPRDKATGCGSVDFWFPEGEWYDFFNNRRYKGNKILRLYRDLSEMPVFVKAGGILPMAKTDHSNDVSNPTDMLVKVYAGADNSFSLYEDDGITKAYLDGHSAMTKMRLSYGGTTEFVIEKPCGDISCIPSGRNYTVQFIGFNKVKSINIKLNGNPIKAEFCYVGDILQINLPQTNDEVKIILEDVTEKENDTLRVCLNFIECAQISNHAKWWLKKILSKDLKSAKIAADLMSYVDGDVYKALIELITADM